MKLKTLHEDEVINYRNTLYEYLKEQGIPVYKDPTHGIVTSKVRLGAVYKKAEGKYEKAPYFTLYTYDDGAIFVDLHHGNLKEPWEFSAFEPDSFGKIAELLKSHPEALHEA